MGKKMILITRRFPYFTTEAFIESEIKYAAEKFDEIIIFPSEISDFKRELPANVTVINDFSKVYQNKRKRAVRALFSPFFYKALLDNKHNIKSLADAKLIFKFMTSFMAYYDFFSKRKEVLDAGLVYTYWLNEAPLALSEVRKKTSATFKLISRAHRYDIYEGLSSTPAFWPYRQKTINGLDYVYVISANGKDYLEEKYPNGKKNVIVSRLGVTDRHKFAANSADGQYAIVSVSRVHPMKRVGFISESICTFAKTVPDTKVVWTHFGDGPELQEIKDKAATVDIPNLVFDFKGNVSNEVIYKHYATVPVDMFINLSSSEGIPVSIMEAQSFGIPVVATNVGGSGEIVVSQTGILLSENPAGHEVVAAIDAVLVQRRFSNEKVKQYWADNYDAEKNYSEFSNSILKLLS